MAAINTNYWDTFPGQRITFALLYNTDKSKNKVNSSEIMWALYMYTTNKVDNVLHNMSKQEREEELLMNYVTPEQFQTVLELEDMYVEHNLSYLQRRFRFYQKMLEQREEYMSTLNYATHAQVLDDMLSKSKKIWDDVINISKQLDVEANEAHVKGGREESATEKELL
ncbi:MAG TPA: hypothetical protein PKD00_01675 [Burkholderiales bacterium]|nr:hypothetical protein [Burkholderiales bacterium]